MKLTMPKPRTRRYAYRVTAAALAFAGVRGWLDGTEQAALLLLASAVLGLADANVPSGSSGDGGA
jgi:hypothetical protein